MNILYISQLKGVAWAGPSFSIPRQIAAQAKYDNVFWYNIRSTIQEGWEKFYKINTLKDYPKAKISDLPEPFNRPDLIIVEQFYGFAFSSILNEILRGNVPYIIIPRGELTLKAQQRKSLKKIIGNFLTFKRFANNALAIQYLTENERVTSGEKWNKNSIVIPNGTDIKKNIKKDFSNDGIICTYIGRLERYQKGLDLLIQACGLIKDNLRKENCKFLIYGPDVENQRDNINYDIKTAGLQKIIELREGIFGEEKEQALIDSDVFIMTSRFEGHPMAMIEALSYGLPCFATRGTNMTEEINRENAGWTSENTVEDIKKALLCMIDDKKILDIKSSNALKLAKQYDWDIIARKSHNEYLRLLRLR